MTWNAVPFNMTLESLRSGYLKQQFTPLEVIEVIIQRAEEDKDKNIWILPPSIERISSYIQQLEDLDVAEYPLWGIPFAIKDNIEVAGWPVTAGCPDYSYTPAEHSEVVARLIAAGAVPVGKTNLDQFATGLVGTRSPYGETHNALRMELISGGSSSGSAVAAARGQCAFSLGTDTAGSGRVPAALNGLVGYKPAVGAWPSAGLIPACRSIDCITVFAHSVEDAEKIDHLVRGKKEGDAYSRDLPLGNAVLPEKWLLPRGELTFYGPFAAAYKKAWEEVRHSITSSGHLVEEVDISILQEAAALLYEGPLVAERWSDLQSFIEANTDSAFPVTEQILRSGAREDFTAAALFRAQHRLAEIKEITRGMMTNCILILPTCGGTWTREQVRTDPIHTNSQMGLYTNHCNLLDLSAVAIPAGKAEEDLPFGITLFSLPEEESSIVEAAKWYQQQEDHVTIAVCGLHMKGMPLEKQMTALRAEFIEETYTSSHYQLYKLDTLPPKPGLVRVNHNGAAIQLELWKMPVASFGRFTASIPSPLGISKIELEDGRWVSGFICESAAVQHALNITASGGWRNAVVHN
ncbi:allophanate hydrolase [Paenibacillus urinalis]|uniref:Allophanate hydrolase n=1 Tax=Paenibacillus urinalis TaxID=521520 RepID=A0AAX3MTE4_9BACL|nr:allophanate hydrolase [Paenibacillus urinalis]WDH80696.1 allophanate hydrolase [Paenibacillus urinalis]WDH96749.1 allophanate hydrolase [Paenibacillus urinalis]WDI00393.1 allophanate hydrolase [Paenibacillus urinalis]